MNWPSLFPHPVLCGDGGCGQIILLITPSIGEPTLKFEPDPVLPSHPSLEHPQESQAGTPPQLFFGVGPFLSDAPCYNPRMKLKFFPPFKDEGEVVASWGEARLIRYLDGKLVLKGGAKEDRLAA